MKTHPKLLYLALAAVLALGCSNRQTVQIPPRVDLHAFDVIGIIDFTSEEEGTLPAFATQRFTETLQKSQPGVYVLELGSEAELKEAIGHDRLDHAAMKDIRERYGVGAVITGELRVEDVRPKVSIGTMFTSMAVSAEVDASLTARLLETGMGATVWTASSRGTDTVAEAGLNSGGGIVLDAQDPERCYGALVDGLILDMTRDFRVTYVRR